MKRGLRLLIWPGSLILLVVTLLTIDFTMIVLASRSSGEPSPAIAPDDAPREESTP